MQENIALLVIIGINVLVSWKGFEDMNFFRTYEFHLGSILNGDQKRMITSGFLHADFMHLIFNMLALLSFGNVIIETFGNLFFLTTYFASLLLGNLLTLYFQKHNYNYRAVGASGAVTGILYSSILMYPDMQISLFFIPIGIPAYIFGFIYLLYSIYGMKAQNDNIGHTAHIGGALAGFTFTLFKVPSLFVTNTFIVVLLLIPIVFLFVLAQRGKI
jgi:membrane associated rhomboid family serine protease